jgi:hypothetical protein
MSIRPTENAASPTPDRLVRVPRTPDGFSEAEARCWSEVARAAIGIGALASSDLVLLARTAKVAARVDALLADPAAKPAHLAALVGLLERLLRAFGLSPLARRGVAALPKREPEGEPDPLADL